MTTELVSNDGNTTFTETFINIRRNLPYWVKPPKTKLARPRLDAPNLVDCRVSGMSCVSRAIGDDQAVMGMNALPSITILEKPSTNAPHQPLCLIVASDGLWDTEDCCGQDVAGITRKWFRENSTDGVAKVGLSQHLVNLAIDKGATDNVTCCTVWVNHWNPTDKAVNYDLEVPQTSRIQWPRGFRTASQLDFFSSGLQHVPHNPRYSGTRVVPTTISSTPTFRRGSLSESSRPYDRIRFSSPPRTTHAVP